MIADYFTHIVIYSSEKLAGCNLTAIGYFWECLALNRSLELRARGEYSLGIS